MDQYEWLALKMSLEEIQKILKVDSLDNLLNLTKSMLRVLDSLPAHVLSFQVPLPENEGKAFSVSKVSTESTFIWDITDVVLRLEATE